MTRHQRTRHREPSNFDAFRFFMGLGFWLAMAAILAGALYVGGLAQYAHMLVDPK